MTLNRAGWVHPLVKSLLHGLRLCAWLTGAFLADTARAQFDWASMTRVDAVDCATDSAHDFTEYPAAISRTQTILAASCRTLSNTNGEMKYFAYRLGKNAGLQAGKGYVLRVLYPQDLPRTIFILNRGCETARGFHTGRTTGDGMQVPYVNNNTESLELPLSGQYESWEMLFFLNERFPGIEQPRGSSDYPRDQTPSNGFWVLCLQLSPGNDPLSAGVAVRRIELYEAPPIADITQPLAALPPGLPKRHLFWREEMADGQIGSTILTERSVADDMTWYEHKFDLMKFLGMRTFAKDLLEFGSNQGWDSSKYGGNDWVYQTPYPTRWSRIVARCGELGFDVLPYYEYKGSKGYHGYGNQRRCRPLQDIGPDYTHITWSEDANADITDADTFEDLRKMLEITVKDESTKATFAGIWLRQRVSDLPVGFGDTTLARFAADTGRTTGAVTRAVLLSNHGLYAEYRNWWFDQRRAFLGQVRDYLRTEVRTNMDLLFTADYTEPGKPRLGGSAGEVVAENVSAWDGAGKTVVSLNTAISDRWQLTTLTNDTETWSYYEWQHAVPHADPVRYTNQAGLYMTYSFNRLYTVESNALAAFRAADGLAAIRHYSLNEDATTVGTNNRVVGYFCSDVDYAGPFVTLPEAMAVAFGDPHMIGYLSSHTFNRGNPGYVRRFNANFLALPALAGTREPAICADPEIVVRRMVTPHNGTYLAVIHTGRTRRDAVLQLPTAGRVFDAVSGATLLESGTTLTLAMDPCELRSLRYFPAGQNTPPEIMITTPIDVEWFNVWSTYTNWASVTLNAGIRDYDPGDNVAVSWSADGTNASQVRFRWTNRADTVAYFSGPGQYTLKVAATDGMATHTVDVSVRVATRHRRIPVTPAMVTNLSSWLTEAGLFDNQAQIPDPPSGNVGGTWNYTQWTFPMECMLDLGERFRIADVWLFDYTGIGTFNVLAGSPSNGWTNLVTCATDFYNSWRHYPVDSVTRYLKFQRMDGSVVGEVVLYGDGGGYDIPPPVPRGPISLEPRPEPAGMLRIEVNANPFCSYRLESASELPHPDWRIERTWRATTPVESLTVQPTNPLSFYRIIEEPSP